MTPDLVSIAAGDVELHDGRSGRRWREQVLAFQIAPVPVTRRLYAQVLEQPAQSDALLDAPAVDVSWFDALSWCNALSQQAGLRPCYVLERDEARWDTQANGYRLPTEAEWERACRAGSPAARYGDLEEIAWFAGNSGGRAHEVGRKLANAWGIHDALGNVWEWCWDQLDPGRYGPYRVFRGGGWSDRQWSCRASCRRGSHPTFSIDDLGFRLAVSMPRAPT